MVLREEGQETPPQLWGLLGFPGKQKSQRWFWIPCHAQLLGSRWVMSWASYQRRISMIFGKKHLEYSSLFCPPVSLRLEISKVLRQPGQGGERGGQGWKEQRGTERVS